MPNIQAIPKSSRGDTTNSFYEASIILIPKLDKDNLKKKNYKSTSKMNINAKTLHKIVAN
jgi:hypothetical protein